MRRLVSSPEAIGNLTFQNTEVPIPNSNECLIRVKAFSMNRGELKRAQNYPPGTPIGWDVVGIVEQTARDGSGPPVGARIVALSIRPETMDFEAIELEQGKEIQCDLVVLSLGSQAPVFPFLPEKYRHLLEAHKDGVQLYRHLIHPSDIIFSSDKSL